MFKSIYHLLTKWKYLIIHLDHMDREGVLTYDEYKYLQELLLKDYNNGKCDITLFNRINRKINHEFWLFKYGFRRIKKIEYY